MALFYQGIAQSCLGFCGNVAFNHLHNAGDTNAHLAGIGYVLAIFQQNIKHSLPVANWKYPVIKMQIAHNG